MKYYPVITNPIMHVKDSTNSLLLYPCDPEVPDWIVLDPVEVTITSYQQELIIVKALSALDKLEEKTKEELTAKLATIQQQKQELLCLTHQS